MSFDLGGLNYWAILAAAAAAFMIGGLWYGLLFAKQWVRVHGYTEEQTRRMQRKQPRNFAIFCAAYLVMGLVISILVVNLNLGAPGPGAKLGVALWLVVAATMGAKNAANDRPLSAWMIDTGHDACGLAVMGLIIAAWR